MAFLIGEATVEPERSPRGYLAASVVVLFGAVLFAVSCFLPYFDLGAGRDPASVSMYEQLQVGSDEWTLDLGTFLFLFGAVAVVIALAIVGMTQSGYRIWTPGMLAVAVLAWASTWFGVLLRQESLLSSVVPDTSLAVGFWSQAASIVIVVLGTFAGLVTARRAALRTHPGVGP